MKLGNSSCRTGVLIIFEATCLLVLVDILTTLTFLALFKNLLEPLERSQGPPQNNIENNNNNVENFNLLKESIAHAFSVLFLLFCFSCLTKWNYDSS